MKFNRSWRMALCAVGMGALFILPSLGISIGSLFGLLLILLCPLSHLLMMRGWHNAHGHEAKASERMPNPEVDRSLLLDNNEVPRVRG